MLMKNVKQQMECELVCNERIGCDHRTIGRSAAVEATLRVMSCRFSLRRERTVVLSLVVFALNSLSPLSLHHSLTLHLSR